MFKPKQGGVDGLAVWGAVLGAALIVATVWGATARTATADAPTATAYVTNLTDPHYISLPPPAASPTPPRQYGIRYSKPF
jgi:hypothetical protein